MEEMQQCDTKYERCKHVHLVVRKLATSLYPDEDIDTAMTKVYEQWVWDMYTDDVHADDVLKGISQGTVTPPHEVFVDVCKFMYQPKLVPCIGELKLMYLGIEGIDKIKDVLKDGMREYPGVKVTYGSQGLYVFTAQAEDVNAGCKLVNDAMQYCLNLMGKLEGGMGTIEQQAKI